MNPDLFAADLVAKPDVLTDLAGSLRAGNPWRGLGIDDASRIVLLGMGSSHYANSVAASRMRARGLDVVAELASSDLLPAVRERTVVVAVSASGGSAETLDAVERYQGRCPVVALTNVDGSAIERVAARRIAMLAGIEAGGVACRSFQHTIALLLALEEHLCGPSEAGVTVADVVEHSAIASADLLARRDDWLPDLTGFALGPHGTHLAAPARRLSSALQGALMLREGPRLPAVGCETGDWSHVDVYLTKSTDYRLLLFAGSRWEPALREWIRLRESTLIAVGCEVPGAAYGIRFVGDDQDDVSLLSEVLVAELLAADAWSRQSGA